MAVELAFTRLAGDGTSPRVLVVGPSLGTSVTALWSACARLLEGVEVVGWDLPGHGRSSAATGPFGVEDFADAVRAREPELAAGRPASYAGVSLGGAVGFALALDPGPFDRVVTIASAPRIGEPQTWRDRATLVRRSGTAALVEQSARRWFAPGFCDRNPEVAGLLLTSLVDADDASYAWACEALAGFDLREQISYARTPLTVAAGEHDEVVPPETGSFVFASCAHLPPAEDPGAVAAFLVDEMVAA